MVIRQSSLLCWRCQSKQISSIRRSGKLRALHALPPPPPPSAAAILTNRRLLTVRGPDSVRFLQGLVTNNVQAGQSTGFYAGFLNAQGRYLHDVFIYPISLGSTHADRLPKTSGTGEAGYMIEVDADEAGRLLKYLKIFKLRSKISLALLEPGEWNVWSVWRDQQPWTAHSGLPSGNIRMEDSKSPIGCVDSRAPGMGKRIILPASVRPKEMEEGIPEATLSSYTIRRMLKGVAEGQQEILRDTALPQESNADYMGGVDFRKGCYVGQELTIRTHHTGVVRKRILPVQIYNAGEDVDSEGKEQPTYDPSRGNLSDQLDKAANIKPLSKKGRSTGKWLAGVGNIGLALCRLEVMSDLVLLGEGTWTKDDQFRVESKGAGNETGDVLIKAFVPAWQRVGGLAKKESVAI